PWVSFSSLEIVALQRRLNELNELIQQEITTAREDTLTPGYINTEPLEKLVLEKYTFQKKIEEARLAVAQCLANLGESFATLRLLRLQLHEYPCRLIRYLHPRSSAAHGSQERVEPERNATLDLQLLWIDNIEPASNRQHCRPLLRRKASNGSINQERTAKHRRRGEISPSLTSDRSVELASGDSTEVQ
ncbi:hypothetical protein IL306_013360, partial [Fusarium sp. DS 682]